MKKIYTLCLLTGMAVSSMAQTSNAIFFTENGERFQVVLNGILQNATAETNVKLTSLNAPQYKARILFDDKKLGYVDFNLIFPNNGMEVTWNIKKNKKGEYVVRYVSDVPLAQAPPSPPAQQVVVYTTTPPPAAPTTTTTMTTGTTTTTGTSAQGGDGVQVNMGVSVHETGGGVNISMSGMESGGMTTGTNTMTTTQTVTTTSTTTAAPPPSATVVYVEGYKGPVGCAVPMSPGDFSSARQSIQSKSFEDSKLTLAKQVFNSNCLTSAQVREIMQLFSFEDSKLEFAKYAYGLTYDPGNYFKVNDAFTFEASMDELNDYINGAKR